MKGIPCDPKNPDCRRAMSDDWNLNYEDENSYVDEEGTTHLATPMSLTLIRPDVKWRRNWRERHSLNFLCKLQRTSDGRILRLVILATDGNSDILPRACHSACDHGNWRSPRVYHAACLCRREAQGSCYRVRPESMQQSHIVFDQQPGRCYGYRFHKAQPKDS